jgi:hypothetical protein
MVGGAEKLRLVIVRSITLRSGCTPGAEAGREAADQLAVEQVAGGEQGGGGVAGFWAWHR